MKYYKKKITRDVENSEVYKLLTEPFENITNTSGNIETSLLTTQLDNLLNQYNTANSSVFSTIDKKIQSYDPNINIYANKNIVFTDGVVGHVTNRGVFKQYPTGSSVSNTISTGIAFNNLPEGSVIPLKFPLVVGSPMTSSTIQTTGYEGSNVSANSIVSPTSSYVGCYQDSETSPAMTSLNSDSSAIYNYQSCLDTAIDNGYTYFALQNVGSNGLAQCFGSNDLTNITQYGSGITQQFSTLWSITPTPTTANCYMTLQTNGDIYFYDSSGNLMTTTLSNTFTINQTALDTCNNYISNVDATYGFNCNSTPAPGSGPYTVEGNNVGSIISTAAQNTSSYLYYIGVDPTTGKWSDPASGCWKNFDLSYTCGNGKTKTLHINGENPGTDRQPVLLSCTSDDATTCTSYLVLQDDGNMCVYIGTSPTTGGTLFYSSNTSSTAKVANPNFLAKNGKSGTNYITSGTSLMPDEWIGSNDGSMCLKMSSSGSLVLTFTTSYTVNCSKQSDGYEYGETLTNAVYQLSPAPTTSSSNYLGNIGYITDNSVLKEYPTTMTTGGTVFTEYANWASSGNDLGDAQNNMTLEQCKASCISNVDCGGVEFSTDGLGTCTLKTTATYPTSARQPSTTTNLYVRNKQIIPDFINEYTKYSNQTPNSDVIVGNTVSSTVSSVDDCKTSCNNDNICGGFSYDTTSQTCNIYRQASSIPTDTTNYTFTQGTDTYLRNKLTKSYDNTNITMINNNSWNNYAEAFTDLTTNYKVNTNLMTEQQQQNINNLNTQINSVASTINNNVTSLQQQGATLSNELDSSIGQFTQVMDETTQTQAQIDYLTKTMGQTRKAMLNDTNLRAVQKNFIYIFWSLVLLILMIVCIVVLRKK